MRKKKRKLKAKTKVDPSGKAQVQYRDTPEAVECLRLLCEKASLSPSVLFGTLLRAHAKVDGVNGSESPKHAVRLAKLKGVISGLGLNRESGKLFGDDSNED